MQFSATLAIAFAAYTAAANDNKTMKVTVITPIATGVQPPIKQTSFTFITYCPSPTAFQVGNMSYVVTAATSLTIDCPTNGCPIINSPQRITAAPMAPYSNITTMFRNESLAGQCPNGASSSANGSVSSGCPPVTGKVSLTGVNVINNSTMCSSGASRANYGASGASGTTGVSTASEVSGASNALGLNAGSSGLSGSSGTSATTSSARKITASIIALAVVAAAAFAL